MRIRNRWCQSVTSATARSWMVVSMLLSSSATMSPAATRTNLAQSTVGQAIAIAAGVALGTAAAVLGGPKEAVAVVAPTSYDAVLGSGIVPWLGGQFCGQGDDITLATLGPVPAGSTILFQGHATGTPDFPCNQYGHPEMRIDCQTGQSTGNGVAMNTDFAVELAVPCPSNSSVTVAARDGVGAGFSLTWTVTYRQHPAAGALPVWGVVPANFGPSQLGSRDPVNTLTGAYTYSHADDVIAGRGPTPGFLRNYSSNDGRLTTLGPGWTHQYATRLTNAGDSAAPNDVVLEMPSGRSDRFAFASTVSGVTTYSPPAGIANQLAGNTVGAVTTYTLTLPDQTKWTFEGGGRLTQITDRYTSPPSTLGASILSYNASGQLTSVSDPAGRGSLVFTYDTCYSSRQCSVTDWTGRVVTFTYDSIGRLRTVADRMSPADVTTYAYEGTSPRLSTITDANSHVAVTMTYDATSHKVLTQKDAGGLTTGQQTTFSYGAPDGQGSVVTTVTYPISSLDGFAAQQMDTYNSQGQTTQHVSKPSAAETLTEIYLYSSQGFRNQITDARGNTTSFCYDTSYSGAALAGSLGNLTRTISPPPAGGGNPLVTLITYDARNNVAETVAPKGVNNGSG